MERKKITLSVSEENIDILPIINFLNKKSERLNDEVSGRHWHVVNVQNNEVYRFEFEHHHRC